MSRLKSFYFYLVLMLVTASLLAACGDSPTATPAAGVNTAAGGTTSGGVGAATTAAKSGSTTLPTIPNTTEVPIDPSLVNAFKSSLKQTSSNDFNLKILLSDDDLATLTDNTDKALTGAGYKYMDLIDTSKTKPSVESSGTGGFYTKAGAADVYFAIGDSKAVSGSGTPPPGVDAGVYQKFLDQVKTKKNVVQIATGTGLVVAILGTPNATATAGVLATATVNAKSASLLEAQITPYPGAKQAYVSGGGTEDNTSVYYLSSDDSAKVIDSYKKLFADKGWTNVSSTDLGSGSTVVFASKDIYSAAVTVSGPQGRKSDDGNAFLTKAGPTDTIISVYLSTANAKNATTAAGGTTAVALATTAAVATTARLATTATLTTAKATTAATSTTAIAVGTASGSTGSAVPAGWQTFTSPEGRFSISLPVPPTSKSQPLDTAFGKGDYIYFSADTTDGSQSFQVSYIDYQADLVSQKKPEDVLIAVRDGTASLTDRKLLTDKAITLGPIPGREYVFSVNSGGQIITRAYLVGNRLYQILAGYTKGDSTDPTIQAYLNSFKVLSSATTGTATTTAATAGGVASTTGTGKVGQAVKKDGYVLTINSIEKKDEVSILLTKTAGKTYLLLDVTLGSEKDSGINANQLYAMLTDSAGNQYDPEFTGRDPAFPAKSDIPSGSQARGWIIYTIPTDAKGLVFSYEPISLNNTVIKVDLGV